MTESLKGNFDKLAETLEKEGWDKEAEMLRRFPRSAWDDELVRGMFVAAMTVKDLCRAEKVARRLIAFAPDNPFAYLALVIVHLRQRRLAEAAQAFERATHFASTLPNYRSLKVHWLCLQERINEAQAILRETMREFSDRWEVQRAQAHFWLATGRQGDRETRWQAVQLLQSIVRNHPDDAIAHALLSQGLWRLGEGRQADGHLQQAAKHLPSLTFTDTDAFVAHSIVKQVLSERFLWLRLLWCWERLFLRLPPKRYFALVGGFWGSVAILLALLKLVVTPSLFPFLVGIGAVWCFYTCFADTVVLWWMRIVVNGLR